MTNFLSQRSRGNILVPLLFVILIITISIVLVYKLNTVRNTNSQGETQQPTTKPKQQVSPKSSPSKIPEIILPQIITRARSNPDSSWKNFSDPRGFEFHFPSEWFVNQNKNEAQQVQNWDPKTASYRPLSGNQSKWDIDNTKENFTKEKEILSKVANDIRIETIEKSSTQGGQEIYFITGTSDFFSNEDLRTPIIFAVIKNGDQYSTWHGIYSGEASTAETLKQIVETITF